MDILILDLRKYGTLDGKNSHLKTFFGYLTLGSVLLKNINNFHPPPPDKAKKMLKVTCLHNMEMGWGVLNCFAVLEAFWNKQWRPKYFGENSETLDFDRQQTRLACIRVSEFSHGQLKRWTGHPFATFPFPKEVQHSN